MQLWIQACGAAAVIGIATAVGCGGNVIVDGTGGGGQGGEGGAVVAISVTTTTGPNSSVSTGPTTFVSSVTSSVSTGPMPTCDNMGDCGDIESGCIGCAVSGPCQPAYETCLSSDECLAYSDCLASCNGNDPACLQKCGDVFPFGAKEYNELVVCVICEACFTDCDGGFSGCP